MKILLRSSHDKHWRPVASAAYAKEDELQRLLAENPEIISIDEIRPEAGPLVYAVREVGLPIGSMDLLAFTARGDIAVIECKLAANPEVKRKVIGQALEYGAHLWQQRYDELDSLIQAREGQSLAELVRARLEDPAAWDEEAFRANVQDALFRGSFILIIVVDQINDDLSRIVRYMNAAGGGGYDFAALEMRRFQAETAEMLVPRVFGPARATKTIQPILPKFKWDEETFFADMHARSHSEEILLVTNKILAWAKAKTEVYWGEGRTSASFVPTITHKNKKHQLFPVYSNGLLYIYFVWYQYKPPFDTEEKRIELLNRLNTIPGVSISKEAISKQPKIPLTTLAKGDNLERFFAVFEWYISEVRNS